MAIDANLADGLRQRDLTFSRQLDSSLRSLSQVTIEGKELIACGFRTGYALINPQEEQLYQEQEKIIFPDYSGENRINAFAAAENRLLMSHSDLGLVKVDTVSEEVTFLDRKGAREVKICGDNLYYLQDSSLAVLHLEKALHGESVQPKVFRAENRLSTLAGLAIDGRDNKVYTSTGRRSGRDHAQVYEVNLDSGRFVPLSLEQQFRGGIRSLIGFYQNEQFNLLFSCKEEIFRYAKDAQSWKLVGNFTLSQKVYDFVHYANTIYPLDSTSGRLYEYDWQLKSREFFSLPEGWQARPAIMVVNTHR